MSAVLFDKEIVALLRKAMPQPDAVIPANEIAAALSGSAALGDRLKTDPKIAKQLTSLVIELPQYKGGAELIPTILAFVGQTGFVPKDVNEALSLAQGHVPEEVRTLGSKAKALMQARLGYYETLSAGSLQIQRLFAVNEANALLTTLPANATRENYDALIQAVRNPPAGMADHIAGFSTLSDAQR